ncbi:MAG: TSCPD domain-containing protein, partial [Candidatus Marinimicrobia bacterium]|nr:TSCPD domain-containing protein [Candidatus Neomarinimicrobiota bacterium]
NKSKFVKSLPKSLRERIKNNGIRNCTLTTVAPTGSGAIVARVTSGVEPIFATSYKRMVKKNDGGYGKEFDQYTVYHPIIKELFGTDEDLPDYVTTSHRIDPFFRVKMQGTVQKYIDSSISSTVNLKENTTIETVADIYMKAYENGLKGITVYREGSREGILITNDDKDEDKKSKTNLVQSRVVEGQPRLRPTQTAGLTRRIKTGEGTLYITINEDEKGLCEVFTTIGKAGGNAAAQSEAISRLISLALRSGVNPQSIVRQLKGISGPNPTWEDGRLILSTPDAIGKALDDYLHEKKQNPQSDEDKKLLITMDTNKDEKLAKAIDPEMIASAKLMMCKICDSRSVVNEGGCLTCQNCGWSKCD